MEAVSVLHAHRQWKMIITFASDSKTWLPGLRQQVCLSALQKEWLPVFWQQPVLWAHQQAVHENPALYKLKKVSRAMIGMHLLGSIAGLPKTIEED